MSRVTRGKADRPGRLEPHEAACAPPSGMTFAVVIPNWNGAPWLGRCLDAVSAQTRPPDMVVVVDNGSTDGSLELLSERDSVTTVALDRNTGFAAAANRGVEAAACDAVALVNTDVQLEPGWLEQVARALEADPQAGAVATKMLDRARPGLIDDAGDVLRRDGVCEQRGRGFAQDRLFDAPGEVFAACAGAAGYRAEALAAVGGFDERFFSYLEDVDLGLRLRLAGWRCLYVPARSLHVGGASAARLSRPAASWVARNTLLLVAKSFPARWAPWVLYRQAAWLWHAARERRLAAHASGLVAALPLLPQLLRDRVRESPGAVAIDVVVPRAPVRGPSAGGHPRHVPR